MLAKLRLAVIAAIVSLSAYFVLPTFLGGCNAGPDPQAFALDPSLSPVPNVTPDVATSRPVVLAAVIPAPVKPAAAVTANGGSNVLDGIQTGVSIAKMGSGVAAAAGVPWANVVYAALAGVELILSGLHMRKNSNSASGGSS